MTSTSVQQMVENQQAKNFVTPVSDRDAGWELFFHGHSIDDCRNAEQRRWWMRAKAHGIAILMQERNDADMHGNDAYAIENDYFDIRRGN